MKESHDTNLRAAFIAEHRTWCSMRFRCHGKNPVDRYSNRGIKVCDRWRESFVNFLADIGPRPSPDHSIDRIDNNGDYCPENCRWATHREQMANTSDNRLITCEGITMIAAEWARLAGFVGSTCIYFRLRKGKPLSDVLEMALDNMREQSRIAD